jgi:hypothetical protein
VICRENGVSYDKDLSRFKEDEDERGSEDIETAVRTAKQVKQGSECLKRR